MFIHLLSNKALWFNLVIASLFVPFGAPQAQCSYSTSTVMELPKDVKLPGVEVFVTDDTQTKDITRSDDALYSLTIKNRGIPYTLEFRKDGYLPAWLSNQQCTGKLVELEATHMTKKEQAKKLSDEQLMDIVRNYKEALDFARTYNQKELDSRVRAALESLATLLRESDRLSILREIDRLR